MHSARTGRGSRRLQITVPSSNTRSNDPKLNSTMCSCLLKRKSAVYPSDLALPTVLTDQASWLRSIKPDDAPG